MHNILNANKKEKKKKNKWVSSNLGRFALLAGVFFAVALDYLHLFYYYFRQSSPLVGLAGKPASYSDLVLLPSFQF